MRRWSRYNSSKLADSIGRASFGGYGHHYFFKEFDVEEITQDTDDSSSYSYSYSYE